MRQFILDKEPDRNGLLQIAGKDYRYLCQVIRVKAGDMLYVRLPGGKLTNATVCKIDGANKIMTAQICSLSEEDSNPLSENIKSSVTNGVQAIEIQNELRNAETNANKSVEYTLIQFIPKPAKMEQIIRQAAECGVKRIIPVKGEYSQKSSVQALENSAKRERILKIIKEARQQSGSPIETGVENPMPLDEAVKLLKGDFLNAGESVSVVFWERNENSKSLKKLVSGRKIKNAAIAVGSEGGISPREIDFLASQGFSSVHFEGNILRCETASLFGIAALQTTIRNENE